MSKNDFMNTDIEIVMFGPEAQMLGQEAGSGTSIGSPFYVTLTRH
jgi:hypothetical protein